MIHNELSCNSLGYVTESIMIIHVAVYVKDLSAKDSFYQVPDYDPL